MKTWICSKGICVRNILFETYVEIALIKKNYIYVLAHLADILKLCK